MTRIKMTTGLVAVLAVVCMSTSSLAWGPQGHRLVGLVAATYLTATARQNVSSLLGMQTLADVATWADQYVEANNQTAPWHYVNIPPFAKSYDAIGTVRDNPAFPPVHAATSGGTASSIAFSTIRSGWPTSHSIALIEPSH